MASILTSQILMVYATFGAEMMFRCHDERDDKADQALFLGGELGAGHRSWDVRVGIREADRDPDELASVKTAYHKTGDLRTRDRFRALDMREVKSFRPLRQISGSISLCVLRKGMKVWILTLSNARRRKNCWVESASGIGIQHPIRSFQHSPENCKKVSASVSVTCNHSRRRTK